MTGSASEHSLLRADSAHSSHSHSHQRPRHQHPSHNDHDHHADSHEHDAGNDVQVQRREPQAVDGASSQLNTDNFVTQVIQTVSLIQYVDPAGSAYETQTYYAPPNTVVIDTNSGNTVTISPPNDPLTAVDTKPLPAPSAPSAPPAAPISSDPVTSEAIPPAPQPPPSSLPVPPESSLPPPSEPLISSESAPLPVSESAIQSPEVTSAPLLPTSAFPVLTGSRNSTNTISNESSSLSLSSSNSTLSAQAVSSSTSLFTTPSTASTSSQARRKSKSRTTSLAESIFPTTSDYPISTVTATDDLGGIGGGIGGTGGLPGDAEPTSTSPTDSDSPSSGGLSSTDKQVIGQVVGSVAGVAVLAMLLFLLLRHKRRRNGQPLFGSGPAPGSRGMITEGGGQGPPSEPPMTERTGAFGVSAALASLNKKAPAQPVGTEERGFYRVSGKKLPSVLRTGGDGYTDPRESIISGNSDYYRGSQEFDPNAAGGGRLALGSPMRPVSGVPVIRTGPARQAVAVTDDNPFADPPPSLDPVGRSLIGQDSSRGSGSRFHERI